MKILKIRENKLKLSLSSEEAAEYGLGNHGASAHDLRSAVERIFADRRELFRIEEKIIVEAYPKMDGSCDVFVTNLPPRDTKEDGAPRCITFWGFASAEHLAFALYMLLCEWERDRAAPLCERESAAEIQSENEMCHQVQRRPLADCYGDESFALSDLVACLKAKTNNDRTQRLRESLDGCRIYKSESSDGEGGCAYILEIGERRARQGSISPMCEFATPISHLCTEVLSEHTVELSVDELVGD